MIARSILIEGHVQGVFFREWAVQRARELGISGWVRNCRDGRVEVFATGTEQQVGRFVKRLREGAPASRVDGVETNEAPWETIEGFNRRQSA